MTNSSKKITAIFVFYIIAIGLRYLTNKTTLLENIDSTFLRSILQGVGPAIGALVAFKVFDLKTSYSLSGKLKPFLLSVLIFVVVPVIGFAIIGITKSEYIVANNIFIASAKLSFYIIIYSTLEEIGWRAFLQEQLTSVNKYVKILIIGTLWFIWHLNFDLTMSNFIFFLILLFASWGIGKIGDITHSVLAVGAFHAFYNLFSTSHFPTNEKYIVLIICAVIWILYIAFYDKVNKNFMKAEKRLN